MTKKDLSDAIHECDDKWIEEAAEQAGKKHLRSGMRLGIRTAAAAAGCVIVLGLGVTVAASEPFRNWVMKTFAGHEVTKVEMEDILEEADIKADGGRHLSLSEDMEIRGEKESFVCKYHIDGDEEVVDKVYSVREDGLKEQKFSEFKGDYDGVPFSFEYVIINREVLGFNYKGAVSGVYHYTDGESVYADLWEVEGDTIKKGCIAKLGLKTGLVEKRTDDDTICNSVMSPNGKMILLNYRAEGYWTVFDIAAGTEKKVEGINGYARTSEISFVDDYRILAFGDSIIKKHKEILVTNLIDLRTQKTVESYNEYGDIQMRWTYRSGKNGLELRDITSGEAFTAGQAQEDVHPLAVRGSYVLFGSMEEKTPFYLCNLTLKKYMKIDVPEGLGENVQIYLVDTQGKFPGENVSPGNSPRSEIFLTDGKDCYLVDVNVKCWQ